MNQPAVSCMRAWLKIAFDAPDPVISSSGIAEYFEAVLNGENDLETLTDLVERTRCIPMMRAFMDGVPDADRERLSNMIAIVEVMGS